MNSSITKERRDEVADLLDKLKDTPEDQIDDALEKEGISREQYEEDKEIARFFLAFSGLADRVQDAYKSRVSRI